MYRQRCGLSGGGVGTNPTQNVQNQLMMRGAAAVGNAIGQELGKMLFGNGAEDAAAAQAREQAEAAERAEQAARTAAAMQRANETRDRLLGEMQGRVTTDNPPLQLMGTLNPGASGGLELMHGESTGDLQLMHGDDGQGQVTVNLDSTPPLPLDGQSSGVLPAPQTVGLSLLANVPPNVPDATVSDYMTRAGQAIAKIAQDSARKSALSGETFAEEELGPYGMTAVIMYNTAQLPSFIFPKILSMVSGDTPPEEASSLVFQSVNRIYTFSAPVNKAIADGVLESAKDQAQDAVADQAKEGVASLVASFLPVRDQAKEAIAKTAPKLADQALESFKTIFGSGNSSE